MNSPSPNEKNRDGARPPDSNHSAEDGGGVSVVDLLLVLVRGRWTILTAIGVCVALGLAYTAVQQEAFIAEATVARESQGESGIGGRLGGSLSMLQGFGIGQRSQGLSPSSYPQVLTSREVCLSVVHDTFYIPPEKRRMTLVEYYNQPGLQQRILSSLGLSEKDTTDQSEAELPEVTGYPTDDEETAIDAVRRKVGWKIEDQSGLMKVRVSSQHPVLAAKMVESFVRHLSDRVRTIRTEKLRENVEFVEERFQEAQQELIRAENQLAEFTDRNQRINSARLRTEQDRLQRQVQFKSQLYSELQKQLTQARIDLQRSEPVITVVEHPVPPDSPDNIGMKLILVFGVFVGGVIGVGILFIRTFIIAVEERGAEDAAKIEEIRQTVRLDKSLERIQRFF